MTVSLLLSLALGFLGLLSVLFLFPKIGLLDFPERYGLKRKKIPYPAGLAIFIGFFISLLLFFPNLGETKILGFLAGLSILTITAFRDDRNQISPVIRLFVQAFAALLVVFSGVWIEFMRNPFSPESLHLPFWLGGMITFIWILGFINVSNWLDGIPNVTIGTGFVSSGVLGILSLSLGDQGEETALLCFILAAILFPFFLGNIGKTKFLLGDTGAMMIGFCLAVFSLFSGGKMATALVVMAIPIFDGIYVVVSRILQKKSPLKGGDGRHLHDILLKKKWKQWQIVLLYTMISSILGITVLFLESFEKFFLILGFTLVFFGGRWIWAK